MKWVTQLKKDKKTISEMDSRNEKIHFVWRYYRLHIWVSIFIAVTLIVAIVNSSMRINHACYVVLINANPEGDIEALSDDLQNYTSNNQKVSISAQYSLDSNNIINSNQSSIELLAASFAIGDLDLFVADKEVFGSYSSQGAFVDLSESLSEDIIKMCSAKLVYAPGVNKHLKPYGIKLTKNTTFISNKFYDNQPIVAIASNAKNKSEAILLLEQLIKETNN